MFTELYQLIKQTNSKEPEIQILTGWFLKPSNIKERIKKLNRILKYKR